MVLLGIGKHVAVPPPAGISQNETLRMVQAAQYYPSLISIAVYGLRFLPAYVKAKQLLSQSEEGNLIGQITLCDVRVNSPNLIGDDETYSWACDDHMGGGILNQFGSHVIDLLQYLTTFKACRVHGTLRYEVFIVNVVSYFLFNIRRISSRYVFLLLILPGH